MSVIVMRENEPPVEALRAVVLASSREGFTFAQRVLREWKDGVHRFGGDGAGFFVAWRRANVVGFCVMSAHDRAGTEMCIDPVYVLPDDRAQGIGRTLVERAVHYGRRRNTAAHLLPKTRPARAFAQALGFAPEGNTHRRAIVAPKAIPEW